jgi:hypothetical protein
MGDSDVPELAEADLAADSALRETLLELFEIGPPLVDPRDHAEPTWLVESGGEAVELLELGEALRRVDAAERPILVAEHLSVLDSLSSHWAVARAAGDGLLSEATVDWSYMCSLCIADSESHAQSLALAIAWRTNELCDAIRLYGTGVLPS